MRKKKSLDWANIWKGGGRSVLKKKKNLGSGECSMDCRREETDRDWLISQGCIFLKEKVLGGEKPQARSKNSEEELKLRQKPPGGDP